MNPEYLPDDCTKSDVVENKPIQDSEFSFEKPAQTPVFTFGQSNSGFGSKPVQNSGFTFKNSPQTTSASFGSMTATPTPNNTFSFGFGNTAPTPSSGTPAENYEEDSMDEDMADYEKDSRDEDMMDIN